MAEEVLRKIFKGGKGSTSYDDLVVNLDPEKLTESLPHWSSGVWAIDYLIGGRPNSRGVRPCPGLPKGKVINLYGLESSGKTTMALTWAAAVQRQGGSVAYIDCEHEVSLHQMVQLGIDITSDRFVLYQPETIEQALTLAWAMVTAGVDLVIYDSVGASMSKAELEKNSDMEAHAKVGEMAKKWSEKLPGIHNRCAASGSIFVGISQVRMNIGVMGHGEKTTVQGGLAWKFYPALRIRLTSMFKEKENVYNAMTNSSEEKVVASSVKAKLDKCKVSGEAHAEVIYYFRFNKGIDNVRSLIESAIAHKIIKRAGAWYSFPLQDGSEIKKSGMNAFREALEADSENLRRLEALVLPKIFSAGEEDSTENDSYEESDDSESGEEVLDLEAELASMLSGEE